MFLLLYTFFFRRESITIIGIKETFPHSSLNFINFLFNGAIGKKVSLVQKRDFIERHCQGLFANRPNTLITGSGHPSKIDTRIEGKGIVGSLSGWKGGDAAAVNKGGWRASRGFNQGVGAYFTVGGPISRRQSEPARIHHRVTPRNNLLGDRLSKPSYLFISPRARSVTLIPCSFHPHDYANLGGRGKFEGIPSNCLIDYSILFF